MPRQNRGAVFLSHGGLEIFAAYKGRVTTSPPWFSLRPNQQIEGAMAIFDIRRLPNSYVAGLSIDPRKGRSLDLLPRVGTIEAFTREELDCKEALMRAIDDDYDFVLACRGRYGQWWRRLMRKVGRPIPRECGLTEDVDKV